MSEAALVATAPAVQIVRHDRHGIFAAVPGTDFCKLRAEGLKPLALAAAAWIFIAIFALVLVKLSAYS